MCLCSLQMTLWWKAWFTKDNEKTYEDEVERLSEWCEANNLLLNVNKTKELVVNFRREQKRTHTTLKISRTPVERVSSIRYFSVHINIDLSYTLTWLPYYCRIVQCLHYLSELKKNIASAKSFYTATTDRLLTGKASSGTRAAVPRTVKNPAFGSPSTRECRTSAGKLLKDPTHPNYRLFRWLRCGKRLHDHMARTETLRRSFFHQAIRSPNSSPPTPSISAHNINACIRIRTCTGNFSVYTYSMYIHIEIHTYAYVYFLYAPVLSALSHTPIPVYILSV